MKLIIAVKIESDYDDFELHPTSKLPFLQRFPTATNSIDWVKFKPTEKTDITAFQSLNGGFRSKITSNSTIPSLALSAYSFYWPEYVNQFEVLKKFKRIFWTCDLFESDCAIEIHFRAWHMTSLKLAL